MIKDKIEHIVDNLQLDSISANEAKSEIMKAIFECPADELTKLNKWCHCKVNHAKSDNFCVYCAKQLYDSNLESKKRNIGYTKKFHDEKHSR